MSSRIDVRLYPSLSAGFIVAAPWLVLAVSAVVIGLAGTPWLLWFCPAGLAGAVWQIRASGLLASDDSVIQLLVDDNGLSVRLRNGSQFQARASAESRLFGKLALLKLTLHDTTLKPPMVVMVALPPKSGKPRNCEPEAFRRLRVWIKLSGAAHAGPDRQEGR